jgi:hypothetical protein
VLAGSAKDGHSGALQNRGTPSQIFGEDKLLLNRHCLTSFSSSRAERRLIQEIGRQTWLFLGGMGGVVWCERT